MFTVHFPPKLKQRIQSIRHDLQAEQTNLLNAVGVELLSLSQQAYLVKSRGGKGSDGISWKPLAASTIKHRNRRGKENAKRKTTKSGKARPIGGGVAIGRGETGFQLSSASPGFSGPDGKGGNLFRLTASEVTVGYNRTYSKYFDQNRPLLPVTLPDKWRKKCDAIVVRWGQDIIARNL